jgi:hypothetical protein
MRVSTILLCASLTLFLGAACSDDGDTMVDAGITSDGSSTKTSALQAVVNSFTVPKTATEFTSDTDKNGTKENALGNIIAGFTPLLAGFDIQTTVGKYFTDGDIVLLLDVLAKDLTADPAMTLRVTEGTDPDKDPKNNFSGTAKLAVSGSPADLSGTIVAGELKAGPGTVSVPLPVGLTAVTVSMKATEITATVSSTGMTTGVITGAVSQTELNAKLLPALAKALDVAWKDPTSDAATKSLIKTFDVNSDASITASDLKSSPIFSAVLKMDVDLDGDKTPDAFSLGMGFTAVPCQIQTTK